VGLACNVGGAPATEEPQPTIPPKVEATEPPKPVEQPTNPPAKSGAVSNLQDVKKAAIQIQAEGTFEYPQGTAYNTAGRGSGFIIDPSGIAVTNNHVVTGAALLKVWVGGDTSESYNARVLGVSECSDLAVIDIQGDGFEYLDWYDGDIGVGLEVYAVGFPLGDPEYTLTKGIISKERAGGESSWASVDYVLEHDATINPGNSGGPLVNNQGQVVGVNYAGNQGTGQFFAIGRDLAQDTIDQLRTGKDMDSLGINGEAFITDDGSFSGIWVYSVESGSPADKAGLEGADIITQLEGLVLSTDGTMADYCSILRSRERTDTLSVTALRFPTGDILEGQINGREIVVTGNAYGDGSSSSGGDDSGAAGEFVTVTNDEGTIQLDVPGEWFMDGSDWEADWGSISFVASSVTASPDLTAYYNNDWEIPGVFFAASKSMGKIGGYIQLLDGTRGWYEGDCRLEGRYEYKDSLYEGQYDLWERCGGTSTSVLVLASRPINNPLAYLMLVEVRVVTDADLDILDAVLNSFQVIDTLP
jgi:serine protease Do